MKKILFIHFLTLNFFFLHSQTNPIYLEGFAQGTTYHITYYDSLNRNFRQEIEQLLKDFDSSVSTYKNNSIISRINKNEKNVKTDFYFNTCFKKAKEVWQNTDGAFDPTVYPLVNMWGWGPGKKEKIEQKKIDSVLNFVGFQLISLKGNTIKKKDKRVSLDFNAFAQGYSVDVVADFLKSKNIKSLLVEIGGELIAYGKKPDGACWNVGIETPQDNKDSINPIQAIATLCNMAVATSGNYRKFTIIDGIKYAHHIDPKTGFPAKNNLLSASLFTEKCIDADANATGLLVMGFEKAKVFLEKHKEIKAYLIYSDEQENFKTWTSPELENILITE